MIPNPFVKARSPSRRLGGGNETQHYLFINNHQISELGVASLRDDL